MVGYLCIKGKDCLIDVKQEDDWYLVKGDTFERSHLTY